jgi:hypothetical protein
MAYYPIELFPSDETPRRFELKLGAVPLNTVEEPFEIAWPHDAKSPTLQIGIPLANTTNEDPSKTDPA